MENGNLIPIELTGQGQNTYSRGMAESTGEITLSSGTSSPSMETKTADLASRMKASGIPIDARGMETIRKMAEMGMLPIGRGSEDEVPPAGDGGEGGNPNRTPQEREDARLFGEENPRAAGGQQQEQELTQEQLLQRRRQEAAYARELNIDDVVGWIVNPEKRDEFFNEIYALVDSRPYDFWQTAFDPLSDGAVEHHFNQSLLRASKGMWNQIEAGPRDSEKAINRDRIKAALTTKLGRDATEADVDTLSKEIEADFDRFQRERQVRRTLHDVNAVLYLPTIKAEQLFENMQQFDSTSGDIALSMPGVREMMNAYESVLREIMAENDGWLPSEKVLGKSTTEIINDKSLRRFGKSEAEERTKARFKKLAEAGLLVTRAKTKNAQTGVWEAGLPTEIAPWEVDRIYTIARGMMIMEERLISLAAESKYPGNAKDGKPNSVRYASAFLQDVIQSTSTYAHMLAKWGITQEAMGAYLFKGEHNDSIAGLFQGWNPNELKKAYEELEHDPEKLFESLDQTYYLGRRNPNRAGDIYTWISWRGQNRPDVPSMLQDYLISGQERMRKRWQEAHQGQSVPKEFDDLDEYQKWSGTGFRFEKLRPALSHHSSQEEKHKKEFDGAFKQAQDLMGRMVDLQPHRIYTVSRWVRERVGKNLTEAQKATISQDIENLAMVESAFLNARERLLDEGKRFDTFSNEDMNQFYDSVITDPVERQRAKDLAAKVREDFARNKAEYWKEFVYKREYTHGYVLWSGDTPADEYNFAALGATGGFVRRARDNMHQAKATEAEVAMLDNLKNITHPDQLVQALFGVFTNIDHYDRPKAQQAIADKAEGLIKFYKASYRTKLPILGVGHFRGRRSASFARMEYGGHQSAWESSDIRYFIEKLEHAHMISQEDAHRLMKYTGATKKHIGYEAGVGFAQLFAAAMLFVVAETSAKNMFKDLDI